MSGEGKYGGGEEEDLKEGELGKLRAILYPHGPRVVHTPMSPLTTVRMPVHTVTRESNLLRSAFLDAHHRALACEVGFVLSNDVVAGREALRSPGAGCPGFA